jgi:uncharacterized membrane protein
MVAGDLAPDHAAEGAWEMSMSHDDRAAGASHPFLRLFVAERAFYLALARAFGGAVLFALPLLMTMEMWWLGFLIRPERLALFLLLAIPLLWTLAWLAGFREDVSWRDALVDGGIAYLVGILAAAAVLLVCLYVLWTFGRLDGVPPHVALQLVLVLGFPGALGAATARLVL